jgi:hypothetical protein
MLHDFSEIVSAVARDPRVRVPHFLHNGIDIHGVGSTGHSEDSNTSSSGEQIIGMGK